MARQHQKVVMVTGGAGVIAAATIAGIRSWFRREDRPSPDTEHASIRPLLHPETELDVEMEVNGQLHQVRVPARRLLVDVLREDLRLTGTHVGCEHGVCGVCTVIVNGDAVRSCILLAVQVQGASIVTVEGLSPDGESHPMQAAFRQSHSLQCGFCTPGFLTTLAAADPDEYPDDDSIRALLSGVLCRCTGYLQIVDAVRMAWQR